MRRLSTKQHRLQAAAPPEWWWAQRYGQCELCGRMNEGIGHDPDDPGEYDMCERCATRLDRNNREVETWRSKFAREVGR